MRLQAEETIETVPPNKDLLEVVHKILDMQQRIIDALCYPNLLVKSAPASPEDNREISG